MELAGALGIERGDVVALVGAGGKSTALACLTRELAARDLRVIITTTTKIYHAQGQALGPLVLGNDLMALRAETAAALDAHGTAVVARRHLIAADKLQGLPPEWIAPLADLADVVLIEADGARGRSLKAPAAHEPVIPACATIVVPLAGLDALGQPLDETHVHRPERVRAIAPEAALSPAALSAVMTSSQGGAKNLPDQARLIPFLNKADALDDLAPAWAAAQQMLDAPRVSRVGVGAVAAVDPAWAVWQPTAAIIMAAGSARRYGQLKQLLPLGGEPALRRIVDTARRAGFQQIVLVLGCGAQQVRMALGDLSDVDIVDNPDWQEGMSASMRLGLAALRARIGATALLLGDQPLISASLLRALLVERACSGALLVAPSWQGRWRNPVIVARSLFAALSEVEGDRGGRDVVRAHAQHMRLVPWDDPSCFYDIDQPQDYARVLRCWGERENE